MDTNNQVPNPSPAQPGFGQRLQHSKALVAIVAVLGVTVLALAAALVVNTSGAQPGSPEQLAAAEKTSQTSKLAADTSKKPVTTTTKTTTTHPVVAQSNRTNVCATCGTVEAVTPVQRQGQVNGVAVGNQTIGLGTVAGGVVGGLLGNQMGGGDGKTAMTVLGVAGGAFAGNQIEKNMKKVTVYEIRVRMDDGSTRNMELSSSVPVGSKVIVEGKNLRLA
ncbi:MULTISPECIES: glycine zipper 2TM domain-containing protein [unclassified Polaromonas]|uniref:glycine zipper 2TM domain-containing protein n=1 Tax=unclassified Polaromonas TaxID=2638319 RepID=UPI000F090E5F|nr:MULTISPECIES: glycine zipper 2TM domain-containing protein [unclassified Polaromonas]AYQ28858.1 glycine zipper 2TM domain-containing protein [Polaromonas sp. SP1]QGJ20026.1 glycine zipper 2TM domain-containing protein [Polaromonas sp. Pch-P]